LIATVLSPCHPVGADSVAHILDYACHCHYLRAQITNTVPDAHTGAIAAMYAYDTREGTCLITGGADGKVRFSVLHICIQHS
jgi:hypothetical protein